MMFSNYPLMPLESCECLRKECAQWSGYYGMCSDAVPAFLSAREEQRKLERQGFVATLPVTGSPTERQAIRDETEEGSFRVQREIHG